MKIFMIGGTGLLGCEAATELIRRGTSLEKLHEITMITGLFLESIKKIVDMYNDDLKGTLDSVDGMLDAGKGYKTFTKLPSGMDGNVKFIYKTDMTE